MVSWRFFMMASCARRRGRRATHHRSIEPHRRDKKTLVRGRVRPYVRRAGRRDTTRDDATTRSIIDAPFAPWWRLSRARDARVRGCVRFEASRSSVFFSSPSFVYTRAIGLASTSLDRSTPRRARMNRSMNSRGWSRSPTNAWSTTRT